MSCLRRGSTVTLVTLVLGVSAAACGTERVGPSSPDFVHCGYDGISGEGLPGNDPSCPSAAPEDAETPSS